MVILEVIYDEIGNGLESEVYACEDMVAAVQKAEQLRDSFAVKHGIPLDKFVEIWNDKYLYRNIYEGEQDRLIAETDDSDRMFVKIKNVVENEIVKQTKQMTREEVLDRLTNMELGLLGEFLTDNAADMDFKFDSRFAYVYSPNEIANIIEEANEEGYDITMNIPIIHDEFLAVTKTANPCSKTMEIQGVADEYDDFVSCFELEKVAKYILCKDSVYQAFLKKCEEDGEFVRWNKK